MLLSLQHFMTLQKEQTLADSAHYHLHGNRQTLQKTFHLGSFQQQ